MQVIQLKKTIEADDPPQICDVLAQLSCLSRGHIKKAINHGAVWQRRPCRKSKRMRRALMKAKPGDLVSLRFKESILNLALPTATCVRDLQDYSIWRKPAGLMTQGTLYGDHCTLSRQVERHFHPRRIVYLVHCLDRETNGLILLEHNQQAAKLNDIFRERKVEKTYHAWIRGDIWIFGTHKTIASPFDNRPAVTNFQFEPFDDETEQSLVSIRLIAGRHHQIRRYFNAIGYPVIGDPRYGD